MKPLTNRQLWDDKLHAGPIRHILPRPGRRQLDYVVAGLLDRHLRGLQGGRVLELGCGGSVWMPYIALRHGMEVSGVDFSSRGLEKSRRILQANQVEAELIEADILMPDGIRTAPYEAIFSLGFLEHFSDPHPVLESAARLLRAHGILLSWVPSTECIQFKLNARWSPELEGLHYLTSREGWINLHSDAGFEVLEADYVQWMDFSMLTFPGIPAIAQKILYMILTAGGLPMIWLERFLGIRLRSRRLCMGLVIAARKR